MKYLPRRESRAERKAKAFKATKFGVAGHQATMKALGNAAGGWERGEYTFSPDVAEKVVPDEANSNENVKVGTIVGFKVGGGHVQIQPNVVDRYKPTEDF